VGAVHVALTVRPAAEPAPQDRPAPAPEPDPAAR
jgi:hypothetical protein